MEERRKINRVAYEAKGVLVVCDDSLQKFEVDIKDESPMGMGIVMPADSGDLVGKKVIMVAETLIMYAEITRMNLREDGRFSTGLHAQKFTPDVLQYLFTHIGQAEEEN